MTPSGQATLSVTARTQAPFERPTRLAAEPIEEELFRVALARERNRADRFEEPFVLVLLTVDFGANSGSEWSELAEALSPALLDADFVGWFTQDSTLGLIRATGTDDPSDVATGIACAIQRQLALCLRCDAVRSCSIRIEVYSPHSESSSAPVVCASAPTGERRWSTAVAKRALDIVGSVLFLIAFSPVYLVVSAFVKITSKGPVFFAQQRVGADGRPFMMFKFRTMHVDVDDSIHQQYMAQFIQSSRSTDTGTNVPFKIVNDRRVTRIGRFLRRSSLDELPQFWNVLKGDMSLVGPRPPIPYEVARYKRWHRRRVLEAKPGITGLWQVAGRSRTTFDEMVRMDLRYAKNHSVLTDLAILLATPRAVISGKGAH
jgi:lipopolysaccharide/colanic/teichoic acid biosynthesis glycosyltransferase